MFDVDARGRYEGALLREEATRVADTETALLSVLAGEVVVLLDTHRATGARPVAARRPVSGRRRLAVLVGLAAAAVAVVAALALRPSRQPQLVPTSTTPSLVVHPFEPPIACELERCPSLAVSPDGDLVAYDQAANTVTWYDPLKVSPDGDLVAFDQAANTSTYDVGSHVLPVSADADGEQVRLVAVGPNDVAYLLVGSPGTDSWELVAIDLESRDVGRAPATSPNIERSDGGLVERLCWSGCEPEVRMLMAWIYSDGSPGTYPDVTQTSGSVEVQLGQQRWEIVWPHTLSTRTQVAPRWDGGAVLSLVAESAEAPSELIELLPDGSVQRFDLGDDTVHTLLADGSAIIWRDGQLVRLSPPQTAEPPAAPWSANLTARPVESPISCNWSPAPDCPPLPVSPDGTLVTYDQAAATLTWYEDQPRVVPVTAELSGTDPWLVAIGPHDVAYFQTSDNLVAVDPGGAEITRVDWNGFDKLLDQTASGLVATPCAIRRNRCTGGSEWPSPNTALAMPWVDLAGNPITDTRAYPTANDTDAGIEVRLGERQWLLEQEQLSLHQLPAFVPRTDGGVVMLLDETFDDVGQPIKLLELLPDGTIERYLVDWPLAVRPDGSVIVEYRSQLIELTPPA